MSDDSAPALGRAMCYRCDRPVPACICAGLPRVVNRTPVLLLQHPRERRHPLGTVRLLRLALERVRHRVCWGVATAAPAAGAGRRAVLYPSRDAVPLRAGGAIDELVVLDGTWSQARALHRANPWLHGLPHVSISPDGVDRYRLRREPQAHCTSTVEAVAHALGILEPETPGVAALLAAFTAMIDRQIPFVARGEHRRRLRVGPAPGALRRRELWRRAATAGVVVDAEFTRVQGHARLTYFVAHALGSGRTLACERAGAALGAELRGYMDLPAGVATARDEAAARAAWQAFAPAAPLLLAWSDTALRLCRAWVAPAAECGLLKTLYGNATGRRVGDLAACLRAQGLQPLPPACPGRAGQRLAAAVTMARFLEDRAERVGT